MVDQTDEENSDSRAACSTSNGCENGAEKVRNMSPSEAIPIPGAKGNDDAASENYANSSSFSLLNGTGSAEPIQSQRHSILTVFSQNGLTLPGELFDEVGVLPHHRLLLTNYRLVIVGDNFTVCSIPLTMMESIETMDTGFVINCRDGRSIRVTVRGKEMSSSWYKKLAAACQPRNFRDIFAFHFYAAVTNSGVRPSWLRPSLPASTTLRRVQHELSRFGVGHEFRISSLNMDFRVCESYPQHLIVPACLTDDDLMGLRDARTYNRIPTVSWCSRSTGLMLLRCSQPAQGLYMSNGKDCQLIDKYHKAIKNGKNRFLYMDLRSYSAAVANFVKGGGYEGGVGYYGEAVFMGMPNIHNVRYFFNQLRALMNSVVDSTGYLQTLQSTNWLQNIMLMLDTAEKALNAMYYNERSVVIHCTDGWDRTSQIVSLCMLIADPFYRTFDGFEALIQRQWVEFGHKFGERHSALNQNANEVSPIFLQFLDAVFQLWNSNPDAFEFNRRYLVKLAQHSYSGLFSTFIFNNLKQAVTVRDDKVNPLQAFTVWDYLGRHNFEFVNPLYKPTSEQEDRLDVPKSVKDLEVWKDAYCCTRAHNFINDGEVVLAPVAPVVPVASNAPVTNPNNAIPTVVQSPAAAPSAPPTTTETRTLSRSQSAASLSSLEQLHNPFHGPSAVVHALPKSPAEVQQQQNGNQTPPASNLQDVPQNLPLPSVQLSQDEQQHVAQPIEVNQQQLPLPSPDQQDQPVISSMSSCQQPLTANLSRPMTNGFVNGASLTNGNGDIASDANQCNLRSPQNVSSGRTGHLNDSFNNIHQGLRASTTLETTNRIRKFLDVDGLSRIPIACEDHMVTLYRELLDFRSRSTQHSNNILYRDQHMAKEFDCILGLGTTHDMTINGNTTVNGGSCGSGVVANGNCQFFGTSASTSNIVTSMTTSTMNNHGFGGSSNGIPISTRRVRNESIKSMGGDFEIIDESSISGSSGSRRKHELSGCCLGQSPSSGSVNPSLCAPNAPCVFCTGRLSNASRNPRHSTPVNEGSDEDNNIPSTSLASNGNSGGALSERGSSSIPSPARSTTSIASLATARSAHSPALSTGRGVDALANGGNVGSAFTSSAKNSPNKIFNNSGGSAGSLDENVRSKSQMVAG